MHLLFFTWFAKLIEAYVFMSAFSVHETRLPRAHALFRTHPPILTATALAPDCDAVAVDASFFCLAILVAQTLGFLTEVISRACMVLWAVGGVLARVPGADPVG